MFSLDTLRRMFQKCEDKELLIKLYMFVKSHTAYFVFDLLGDMLVIIAHNVMQ